MPPAGFNAAAQRLPPIGPPPPMGTAPQPLAPANARQPPVAAAVAPAAPAQQLSREQRLEGVKQMLRVLEEQDKLPDVRALHHRLSS